MVTIDIVCNHISKRPTFESKEQGAEGKLFIRYFRKLDYESQMDFGTQAHIAC